MNQFPDNLRRLRERRGMNRRALSELVGISKNMVSRYERGERLPDIKTAMEIADFFEFSLDDLCGHEKNF